MSKKKVDIEHVVVLMLENHSFDSMLGALYQGEKTRAEFNGLSGDEFNYNGAAKVSVAPAKHNKTPNHDPGESFEDITTQIFGGLDTSQDAKMQGFVLNYMQEADKHRHTTYDPQAVMRYFTDKHVPNLTTLARHFGVSDQWHASVPAQTLPNRYFVHTGTSLGAVENTQLTNFPFAAPSIFSAFKPFDGAQSGDKTTAIYYHDVPYTLALDVIPRGGYLRTFDQFLGDAQSGVLPNYSFIEPRYFPDVRHKGRDIDVTWQNDMHPPSNVGFGDQLIGQVYEALRRGPAWKKTLLIITFDEHGGCFDHAPPPQAVPPDGHNDHFNFDRYGVRVPAVFVSHHIPKGSVIRPTAAASVSTPFDHTSIIKSLIGFFGVDGPQTKRTESAPDFLGALDEKAHNNGPHGHLSVSPPEVSKEDAEAVLTEPPSDLQRHILQMAALLKSGGASPDATLQPKTAAEAGAIAREQFRAFLDRTKPA